MYRVYLVTALRGRFSRATMDVLFPLDRDRTLQEGQQVSIDSLLMCCGESVGSTGIIDFLRPLNQLGGLSRRILHGYDLIVLSMKNQCREIKLFQVYAEVCLGECLDAFIGIQCPGLHAPQPELIQNAL